MYRYQMKWTRNKYYVPPMLFDSKMYKYSL